MISVIIPIYNAEKYLRRTAQCILGQTLNDYEVLLINDGSTDCSEQICRELENLDGRFHVFTQPNSGVSAARNLGLQKAQGAYITFLDADDLIPVNYLEELYKALTEQQAQMSVCDVALITDGKETGRFTCASDVLTRTEALNHLLSRREINSGPYAKLFFRAVVENVKFPPLKAYEDILFVIDAVNRCQKIAATDRTEYLYEQNQGSTMGNFKKMPSLDVVAATKALTERIDVRQDLSPECLYVTLSHLMQYVQPLVGNTDEKARIFVLESQKLMKKQIAKIWKCSAFPWKEKIVFTLFSSGWSYYNRKLIRIKG